VAAHILAQFFQCERFENARISATIKDREEINTDLESTVFSNYLKCVFI
jgi:hypothetical protein